MALTDEDVVRLNELFAKYPGRDDVARDENKINKILVRVEKRAAQEHQNLLDSRLLYSNTKFQPRKRFDN